MVFMKVCNKCYNLFSKVLKNEGKSVNIQEVMDQWTLQMGYPVITILRNETVEDGITITQEHFLYNVDVNTRDPELRNNRYSILSFRFTTKALLQIFVHFCLLTFSALPRIIMVYCFCNMHVE